MARFVDAAPLSGAVLVLPPDDFYQMPYRWGYYGTDSFIPDLMNRPVLVPSGQGYSPASVQLLRAVDLTTQKHSCEELATNRASPRGARYTVGVGPGETLTPPIRTGPSFRRVRWLTIYSSLTHLICFIHLDP